MFKINFKKRIILILCMPILCSIFLCFLLFPKTSDIKETNGYSGFISSNTYIKDLLDDFSPVPSSYGLDNYYPIMAENQYNSNLCWVYSSLKVLETSLMKQKNEYHNFSEIGMAYLNYLYYTRELVSETSKYINTTGNFEKFNDVVQSKGLVYENSFSNDIYFDIDENNYENYMYILDHIDTVKMDNIAPINIHEDTIYAQSSSDKKLSILKKYIMKYGGIFSGLERGIISSNTNTYIRTDEINYSQYDGTIPTNHAVCIIGWDDNHDCGVGNGKGAFYVLNSWGVASSDYTYFYIPYSYSQIFNDTYGYICLDGKESVKLNSSTSGGEDGFSKIYLENSANLSNLFLYGENLSMSFDIVGDYDFDKVFINIYQNQSNVTSKFAIDFDDDNKRVTISALESNLLELGEGYYIEFYNDDTYIGTKDFYIFTGTEVSYIELYKNLPINGYVESTFFNNNFSSAKFSETYYIYNSSNDDYLLKFYLSGLKSYTYSKVILNIEEVKTISTNSNDEIVEEDSSSVNVELGSSNKNLLQVKIKNLFGENKMVRIKISLTSHTESEYKKKSYYCFNIFVSPTSNIRTSNANNIIYELNGGINSIYNIDRYPNYTRDTLMTKFLLSDPVKDSYNFMGWYYNNSPITEISSVFSGDIVIYAKWEEKNLSYYNASLSIEKIIDYDGEEYDYSDDFEIVYGDSVLINFSFTPEFENLKSYKYVSKYYYYFNDVLVETKNIVCDNENKIGSKVEILNNFLNEDNSISLYCGSYNIKIVLTMVVSHRFSLTDELNVSYSINQKEITANFNDETFNYVYDAKFHIPEVISFDGLYQEDVNSFKFYYDNSSQYKVGEYLYKITSINNPNYVLKNEQSCTLKITEASISIEWIELKKTYNGKKQSPTYKINGIIGNDFTELYFSKKGNIDEDFKGKDVGTYNIIVKDCSNKNYKIIGNKECVFEIIPAKITIKFNDIGLRFTIQTYNRLPTYKITYTVTGDLYDDESSLNIEYVCDGERSNVSGDYPIIGSYSNANYDAEIINGTYSIYGYYYIEYTLPNGSKYTETVEEGQTPNGINDTIYKTPFLCKLKYSDELVNNENTDMYIKVTIKSYRWIIYIFIAAVIVFLVYFFATRNERINRYR